MHLIPALLIGSLASPQLSEEGSLLAAVPEEAFALLHVADPNALRSRAELNDWVALYGSPDGEPGLHALAQEYEEATGTDFDGLFELALELHGEALLFFTGEVAGFLAEPPPNRAALADVLNGWLTDQPRRTVEIAGGRVELAAWPDTPGTSIERTGHFLAFLDHPLALGLYSGDSAEAVLEALEDSLGGLLGGERRAPVVAGFLAAGGGTTRGIAAFVDFTPFVGMAEKALREAVESVLPDPTGLLGLEGGTWLFATADVSPGTHVEVNARLRIPEGTLAAELADSLEPLPIMLPPDLPRGTWYACAIDWNVSRFYATARAAFEREEEGGLIIVDQGLAAAKALSGVDPVEDVLEQLEGLFALYHVLDPDELPLEGEEGFGFLAGLVDGNRFLDAFEAVLGVGGIGVDPIELEGAKTYLGGRDTYTGGDDIAVKETDGGLSILPHRLLVSFSRETLVRGLRALGRVEGAGLKPSSQLQAAFDENAGAFAFAYAELSHLRTLALLHEGKPSPDEKDPFDSQLTLAAHRTTAGFEVRLYTR